MVGGHNWMKLWRCYQTTHFMHVMLVLLCLQKPTAPTSQHSQPSNATRAQTSGNPPQQNNTYYAPPMLVLHRGISTSASTSADAHHQAAHPQRFKCMQIVPQVLGLPQRRMDKLDKLEHHIIFKAEHYSDNRRIYNPERVVSPQ